MGKKLFQALENYKIPKNLVGVKTDAGVIPNRFGRFFRDREELPAADDLTAEIRKALGNSDFMIVICSPSAAASRWVNKEILEFKRLHGEKRVLSVIIDGEPFVAGGKSDLLECFPPSLRYKLGPDGKLSKTKAEPIAADLRGGGDGWHRAFMKITAGLLGVGLDTLISRDLQRKNRRVTAITALSIIGMLVMSYLTNEAMDARLEADKSRGEAEGLIEFMLTDLRERLEPVGRLDVLDAVGNKVVDYYDKQNMNDLSDDAIGRRARSHHMLGEINNLQGNKPSAKVMFDKAMTATSQLMLRDPENPDRIFEHAQSVFWAANQKRMLGDLEGAYSDFSLYSSLAAILVEKTPDDIDTIREAAYAESNMGTLLLTNLDRPSDALIAYEKARLGFQRVIEREGPTDSNLLDLANIYAWLAEAKVYHGSVDEIIKIRQKQLATIKPLFDRDSLNLKAFGQSIIARKEIARYELLRGSVDVSIIIAEENFKDAISLIERDADNMLWLERAIQVQLSLGNLYFVSAQFQKSKKIVDKIEAKLKKYYVNKTSAYIVRGRLDYPFFLIKAQLAFSEGNLKLARSIASELTLAIEEDINDGHKSVHTPFLSSAARLVLAATYAHEGAYEDAKVLLEDSLMQLLKARDIRFPETDMILLQYYRILGRDTLAATIENSLNNRGYKPFSFIDFPILQNSF